jgi:hypothetical protein
VERSVQANRATGIGDNKVLVIPFVTQDLGQDMMVGNDRDIVVRVVRGHDGQSIAVDNGSAERGEVESAELARTPVDWSQVDALLGHTKGGLDVGVSVRSPSFFFFNTPKTPIFCLGCPWTALEKPVADWQM